MAFKDHSSKKLPQLLPGRVYRTRDFRQWTKSPSRLVKRLLKTGTLTRLGRGLFDCQRISEYGIGPIPSKEQEIMRAFLGGSPFLFSGPLYWNALSLGTTQLYAIALVYNTKRSGLFTIGGRRYKLRRVKFPREPILEWWVVDLFEHGEGMGMGPRDLAKALARAVQRGRFDVGRLREMARTYGGKETRRYIETAIHDAATRGPLTTKQDA